MASKTEEKRAAIAKLRELLHTQSHTEHDLGRLSIDTLKTLIERVEHVRTRAFDNGREHNDGTVPTEATSASA